MPWYRADEGLKSDDARVIMDEGYEKRRARTCERERGREDGIDERTLNLMGLPREINEEIVMIRREGLKKT